MFRRDCVADFDATLSTYKVMGALPTDATLDRIGRGGAKLTVTLISDETALTPKLDLNGDGDFLDTDVPTADLRAGILRIRIAWNGVLGERSFEHTAILARGEL